MITFIIIIGICIFVTICGLSWFISTSNAINRIKLKIEESLSSVEIQLRQRYDILMQGKNIVEQYANYEHKVFSDIRNLMKIPTKASISQLNEVSESQETVIKGLFALSEAYPELRSAELFNNLLNELSIQTQNYSASRRAVNGNITKYNNYVVTFPSSIICNINGYTKMDYIHEENVDQFKNIDMNMNIT